MKIFMFKIKFIFFVLISMFAISSAMAKCDFGIKLGDKFPERFEGYAGFSTKVAEQDNVLPEDINLQNGGIVFVYLEANEICNTSTLKDIDIEFTFLYGELASIKMIAINDEKNIPTKKLTLMKYAKLNYGDFDTGFDEQTYNNFHHWRKNKSLVIYSRIYKEDHTWDEEIYITNDKYEEILNMALSGEQTVRVAGENE